MFVARRWDQRPDAGQGSVYGAAALSVEDQAQGFSYAMAAKLTPAQIAQLEAFAKTLSREQALWVSGYLAGIGGPGATIPVASDLSPPSAVVGTTATILYGSETGNSASLAKDLAARLQNAGLSARASDMDNYKTRGLKDERFLLVIISTHGEGDPPQSALNFFELLESRKAPALPALKFAVLALGDSTYEKYCEAGKRVDLRLEELGATRLLPRVDCDVDYESPAAQWMAAIEPLLPKAPVGGSHVSPSKAHSPASAAATTFDKRNPFDAPIIENLVLTGRGSTKETRHIEFSLAGSDLTYEPGDALGLLPLNDIELVNTMLAHVGIGTETRILRDNVEMEICHALTSEYEIVAATPRFLESWARLSQSSELQKLIAPGSNLARNAYLHNHHVIDIIRAFPVPGVTPAEFLAGLRPLQPRLYSIASSQLAVSEEVHLTVSTVRYELHGEPRSGVTSGYLAARGEVDSTLPVYIQPNPHFRLPADDAPIIMIGAGTGVAPYRAFLQEREARGAAGKTWLLFGERNFRSDFLYQVEWQDYLKTGLLTRMDVAFSRDRADKIYVQHRLRDQAAELYAWLEEGAYVYVCGDAAQMAPDVHAALLKVAQDQGHLGPEMAEEYLRTLQRDHRYQRDVY